jgi:hypothetical protein
MPGPPPAKVGQNIFRESRSIVTGPSFLEATGFAARAGGANLVHEEVVESVGFLGRGGIVEGGALAATDISVQRELGDCQHTSAYILDTAVHLS